MPLCCSWLTPDEPRELDEPAEPPDLAARKTRVDLLADCFGITAKLMIRSQCCHLAIENLSLAHIAQRLAGKGIVIESIDILWVNR
jgi:hypothetical protein